MILIEIITEAEYEFLKLWYSCELITSNECQESILMIQGEEVLFIQDWKNKILWCKSELWSFFESKFGYNISQVRKLISSVLKEHLKQGVLTPLPGNGISTPLLEK